MKLLDLVWIAISVLGLIIAYAYAWRVYRQTWNERTISEFDREIATKDEPRTRALSRLRHRQRLMRSRRLSRNRRSLKKMAAPVAVAGGGLDAPVCSAGWIDRP
ncbi:MAG: hypothetical protein C3F11_05580 [Methylocystaceae bacterium]|nr:MAG: hypothetical protein C3F11_05580 [Methylocystaceae bacterium]